MLGRASIGELRATYGDLPREEREDALHARLEADFNTFDFVFTNPPFGANIPIDDPNILK